MKNKKPKKQSKYVYLCGIDWQHELGEEMFEPNVVVYPSIKSLKKHRNCWQECGIVKLKVTLEEWVEPENLFKNIKK